MILRNPTDKTVSVVIKGIDLSVEPLGSVEVSEAEGQAWRLIHEFLFPEDAPVKVEVKAEKPVAKVELKAPVASSPSALVPSPGALTAAPKADK